MRVLLASHTAMGGVFKVGSHHLVRELEQLGHQVLHLSTPVSVAHAVKARDPEVRRRLALATGRTGRSSSAAQLVPLSLVPMSVGPRLTSALGLATTVPPLRSVLRRRGFAEVDVLVVDQPLLAGIERFVSARRVVYRGTDLVATPAKLRGEAHLLGLADAVVGTSPRVLDHLRSQRPDVPSLLLENGVQFEHFHGGSLEERRVGGDAAVRRTGAVYMGAMDERFDWACVSQMAASNPDVQLTLIGPRTSSPGPLPANVEVRGPVPYEEVPRLLQRARVGILPFKVSQANAGRSPMKLYEYLASGLNVVSTVEVRGRAPGVFTPGSGEGPGDSLRSAMRAPDNDRGVDAAHRMDWRSRAVVLERFLTDLLG